MSSAKTSRVVQKAGRVSRPPLITARKPRVPGRTNSPPWGPGCGQIACDPGHFAAHHAGQAVWFAERAGDEVDGPAGRCRVRDRRARQRGCVQRQRKTGRLDPVAAGDHPRGDDGQVRPVSRQAGSAGSKSPPAAAGVPGPRAIPQLFDQEWTMQRGAPIREVTQQVFAAPGRGQPHNIISTSPCGSPLPVLRRAARWRRPRSRSRNGLTPLNAADELRAAPHACSVQVTARPCRLRSGCASG